MLSVVIPTLNDERHLPRCFDALITPTVNGVVKEVVVADGGSKDETLTIADFAGAKIIQTGPRRCDQLSEGAKVAKSDWLLFLNPETALEQGWEREVELFIERTVRERPRAAIFRYAVDDFGGRARRSEWGAAFRSNILGLAYGDQGLVISKHHYRRLGGYRNLPCLEDVDIIRRIGRRRLVGLRSRAVSDANGVDKHSGRLGELSLLLLCGLRLPTRMLVRLAG